MNKTAVSVRAGAPARRSDRALVHALVQLTLEKRFDAITVQQVLDRADVGRTTFYARYRGKDDLLIKSFVCMLDVLDQHLTGQGPSGRVAPVRELFTHVREAQGFHKALGRSRKLDDLYQAGIEQLGGTIAARLPAGKELLARGYAGALMALLRWWVDTAAPQTPGEMDDLFHEMVRA